MLIFSLFWGLFKNTLAEKVLKKIIFFFLFCDFIKFTLELKKGKGKEKEKQMKTGKNVKKKHKKGKKSHKKGKKRRKNKNRVKKEKILKIVKKS